MLHLHGHFSAYIPKSVGKYTRNLLTSLDQENKTPTQLPESGFSFFSYKNLGLSD
ncbi:MAG: hypothetical protein KJ856_20650 [Gammaproteobacteria bacterium]|nr:hypothetical protein [Gammaproteobacteria bacterium]MBU1477808.1 hypothetical protein [Gammaproteobacteria bacterium]MBU2001139.1 hypothetical protein [Gammaproteobacteria bacterium]MBU2132461.1 hypothetical protein [Gammaproteobacteria bacterium]MBU2189398.1 hypothetical protein [Gammaproteobacteria bacterium]